MKPELWGPLASRYATLSILKAIEDQLKQPLNAGRSGAARMATSSPHRFE